MPNAYAHSRTEDEFAQPEYAAQQTRSYAVPSVEDGSPYAKQFGWSPALRLSPTSLPDATRLGKLPVRAVVPNASQPPQEFWGPLDSEKARRTSVEQVSTFGAAEPRTGTGHPDPSRGALRWLLNPRTVPPAEPRVTNALSPHAYRFWRPFLTNTPKISRRTLNGEHFSMADHRRTYDIYGMAPQRKPGSGTRNTYRLMPGPWDQTIVDVPTPDPVITQTVQRTPVVETLYSSRSWRL